MSMYTDMIAKIKEAKSERAGLGVLVSTVSDANTGDRDKLVQDILVGTAEVMAAIKTLPAKPKEPEKREAKPASTHKPKS